MNNTAKYALVTGSAKGFGRAIALALAKQGYSIIIHYLNSQQEAEQTVKEINAQTEVDCFAVCTDLCDYKAVESMFAMLGEKKIRLEILVQNVGNYLKKNILETGFEEWNAIINSNLNATFYCNRLAAQSMLPHQNGRIINIGFANLGQFTAQKLIAPYYIAKNGVLILTKSLAAELADKGITVNMISPGVLETSVSQPLHEIPTGRLATLEETIRAILFIADPKSSYITGANLDIAGGWRL